MIMQSKLAFSVLTFILAIFMVVSCDSADDALTSTEGEQVDEPENPIETEDPVENIEGLEVLNASLVFDGYILVNDAASNRVYLMDKGANIIFEWDLKGKRLGNDAYLLSDGRLLAMLETENPFIEFGGFGGLIALINKESEVEWSFEYSNEDHIAHHDAVMMPNGNILFLSWEKKSLDEANAAGYALNTEVIYDAILEINPNTNQIVWQWHMWDHIIQDFDNSKNNFATIAENPRSIDVNYVVEPDAEGDISHANGIDYDEENDLIYLSVNFYNEIWVIDHSTTTEEAASSSGGNFGFGGDLVYRFGNPDAYDNPFGEIRFDRNHHPNLLKGENKGNILVFANGLSKQQSTAYELELPSTLSLRPNEDNEPITAWSFTQSNLFFGKVSGVALLPNGNRLITEGDFGFWEVTEAGEVVWRYETPGFFWRGYHFDKNDPAIQHLEQ